MKLPLTSLNIKNPVCRFLRQMFVKYFPSSFSVRLSRISFPNISMNWPITLHIYSTSQCYFSRSWQLFSGVHISAILFYLSCCRDYYLVFAFPRCFYTLFRNRKELNVQWSAGEGFYGVWVEEEVKLTVQCWFSERRKRCPCSRLSWTQWLLNKPTTRIEK